METIDPITIDDFKAKTSYDLYSFFNLFVDFVDNDYNSIVNYYNGSSVVYPKSSFELLKSLIKQGKEINDVFVNNASNLETYDYWVLLEQIDDMRSILDTANNASRWCRSSISSSQGYVQDAQIGYVGKQGQGLEQIERDIIGSSDPEETWVGTALKNQLNEEDYTMDGNYLLQVSFSNGKSIKIQSVVDNIDSVEKTYGLDLSVDMSFINNDLAVLNYQDTLMQSANILASLKQGDNKIVPYLGIDPKLIGYSMVGFSYPTLFRQISQSFASDDSFESFAVIDIVKDQDSVALNFQVKPRAGKIIDQTVTV